MMTEATNIPEITPEQASREPRARDGVLQVKKVNKSFKGQRIVEDVSLGVRRGESVGLLGPNGAGKTTCFYIITGLIKPDEGEINLNGDDITNMPMYQRARLGIGYLPQEASIFRGLNVEDNIKVVVERQTKNRKKQKNKIDELLEEFKIGHLRKSAAIALSGGERRRLEIARAIAAEPTFILLDEPFAGIDPIAIADIFDLVRHLTQTGIGVLITDHNVRETLTLTDRAYIMAQGKLLAHGKADEIVKNKEVKRIYLGDEFTL